MVTTKAAERLKSLQAKQQALTAKIQQVAALNQARIRKQELQRKILVGSYYLELATKENNLSNLNCLMREWLTRASDKKLFANCDSA